MTEKSRLAAELDSKALGDDEARALWTEFSAHMDANRGDMIGFAKLKGWQSVAPEYRAGRAVLVAWSGAVPVKKSAPQQQPSPKPKPKQKGPPPQAQKKPKPKR
jgi:hypothetical protein